MPRIWQLIFMVVAALAVVAASFETAVARRGAGTTPRLIRTCEPPTREDGEGSRSQSEIRRGEAVEHVPSPTDGFSIADVDLLAMLQQFRNFRLVDRFTLPTSGVVVEVHSDGGIMADPAAIDELLHARLRLHHEHKDPALRARMRCYERVIVDEQSFAGAVVNIYVPSRPEACIRNLRLVVRVDGSEWSEQCHWRGATPPVRLSGMLGEIRLLEYHVVVAPGMIGWSNASPDPVLAEILRHEASHLWDWAMGVSPRHVLANERRALRGDALVHRHYARNATALPNPFFYPMA